MSEKEAKYDLPDFFIKSHISVKNDLLGLKIWLQTFLDMGYRMDIVRLRISIEHSLWASVVAYMGWIISFKKGCMFSRSIINLKLY
jgi:hypothetical protein